MFDIDRWQEIWSSMRSNSLRTILSGFTVTLGLFIFVVLFGIGNGLQKSFSSGFMGDAANLISIFTTPTSEAFAGMQANRTITLKNDDYTSVTKDHQPEIEFQAPSYTSNMLVKYKNESGNYQISGSTKDEEKIEDRSIMEGRYLNDRDIENHQNVAVIGRLVQKDLIKDGNPIGKTLTINGSNFTVIGVFTDTGGDWDERVISIPISTLQKMKKSSDTLNTINLTYAKNLTTEQAIKLGENLEKDLKQKHRISPEDKGGIIVRNAADNMKDTLQFMLVLTIIVGVIGIGTLTAGVLGISNIMVFIVKERTKEIGIRKAIGAKPSSIVGLILQESIVVTVLAGIIGILLGVFSLYLIGNRLEEYFITDPSVTPGIIITAFFCLVIAGAIAGFVPAYKASKIKPIEALRAD